MSLREDKILIADLMHEIGDGIEKLENEPSRKKVFELIRMNCEALILLCELSEDNGY